MSHLHIIMATFLLCMSLTYLVYRFALWKDIVPKANFRRKTDTRVALLGGLGIYVSLWAGISIAGLSQFAIPLLIALPIAVFGVWDDVFELSARYKISGQLLAVGIWMSVTPADQLILSKIGLSPYIALPLSAFWILGMMNATNMIDGMDGEASVFAVIAGAAMAAATSSPPEAVFLCLISAAYFGFLVHNFAPARIYLGDSGGQLSGLLLGMAAVSLPLNSAPFCQIFVPLFVFAFPEADCLLAIIRRLRAASSPLKGDHDHLHHKLLKAGLSVRQAWGVLALAIFYSGFTAWAFEKIKEPIALWVIGLECTSALLLMMTSLYAFEFLMGRKISKLGNGMIQRYFRVSERLTADANQFRATVFDLQPYFQELQTRGIAEIDTFIRDLRRFVDSNYSGPYQVGMWGFYSIVILESHADFDRATKKRLITAAFRLLESHGLKKNDTEVPWGLKFYSTTSRNRALLLSSNVISFEGGASFSAKAA